MQADERLALGRRWCRSVEARPQSAMQHSLLTQRIGSEHPSFALLTWGEVYLRESKGTFTRG